MCEARVNLLFEQWQARQTFAIHFFWPLQRGKSTGRQKQMHRSQNCDVYLAPKGTIIFVNLGKLPETGYKTIKCPIPDSKPLIGTMKKKKVMILSEIKYLILDPYYGVQIFTELQKHLS